MPNEVPRRGRRAARESVLARARLRTFHTDLRRGRWGHRRRRCRDRGGIAQGTFEILDGGDRVEEVARMLGGVRITAKTRSHAEEMLGQAGRELPVKNGEKREG
jgi:hypothetical protein